MFAMNDERKKFYADKPAENIFDGSASGRALSMRYGCDYPGSIVDQLRSSQTPKPSGTTAQTKADTGQYTVGTSDTLAPSGNQNDSSTSSDSDDSYTPLPDVSLVSAAQNSAKRCMAGVKNLNREVLGPNVNGSFAYPVQEGIVRCLKKTEPLSCTDSDSDAEISASEYVSKNRLSHTKLRKRRKKITANIGGTRYEVGKYCSLPLTV